MREDVHAKPRAGARADGRPEARPEPRTIGRFELRRPLGRGAQAEVWLAHDPKLERDVALKRMQGTSAGSAIDEWLREARAVSRLKHPSIVPVFDAGESAGAPYLVFEFVDGGTLAERMRRDGAWPARSAVALMADVLDALAEAHAQGIVHRDLKPSNVLIDKDGRPRVMDFGIAARVGRPDGLIVGTPGYLSPEAARGEAPAPAMDVYSAGVMLAELIGGRRLLDERDPMRALERVQREDLELAPDVEVDDGLRHIVQRALARDVALRPESAAALRDALRGWLDERGDAGGKAAPAADGAAHGTVEFLLRRMRHKADFPALGDAVLRIQRAATSETESVAGLSAEILRDVALTNKLLRIVNSATFGQAGGGGVTTISRAVQLIGFSGVRNLALALVLVEHMQDQRQATHLRDAFLHALVAGAMAAELAPLARESEEAFISTLMQNLGRMLTEFYFPEEAAAIRTAVEAGDDPEDAAHRVLGIGWTDLASGVARSWGLPDSLQRAMRRPDGDWPRTAAPAGTERMRWIGRAAHELTRALMSHTEAELPAALHRLAEQQSAALNVAPKALLVAAATARHKAREFASAVGGGMDKGRVAQRLMGHDPATPERTLVMAPAGDAAPPQGARRVSVEQATTRLTEGIAEVTQQLAEDGFKLNIVLHRVLETMQHALALQRIVLCLRDPKTDTMVGRLALGAGGMAASKPFAIALRERPGAPPDLFAAVCRKGADTVITDATRDGMADRLPAWYRSSLNAPSFLLLPLMLRQAPLGLVYADCAAPGALAPEEKELSLLRALRNQMVMAFRQAGH